MISKTYNGQVRSSKKDFETLQLGAFATPGLLLAQGPVGLTAESGMTGAGGMPNSVGSSERIVLDELPLVDLQGNPARLGNYFQQHLLLIFLRHLA
jgi:hypothetical protein